MSSPQRYANNRATAAVSSSSLSYSPSKKRNDNRILVTPITANNTATTTSSSSLASSPQRSSSSSSSSSPSLPSTASNNNSNKNNNTHPYSSLALSLDRKHVVVAGKDTLRIYSLEKKKGVVDKNNSDDDDDDDATSLCQIRSIRVSQYFQNPTNHHHHNLIPENHLTTSSAPASIGPHHYHHTPPDPTPSRWNNPPPPPPPSSSRNDVTTSRYNDVRDTFQLPKSSTPHHHNHRSTTTTKKSSSASLSSVTSITLTDVAQSRSFPSPHGRSSLLAAAGSNGRVVVWHVVVASDEDDDDDKSRSLGEGDVPEASWGEHSRSVNRLAWHPGGSDGGRVGWLLTASQDATVKLWDRGTPPPPRPPPPAPETPHPPPYQPSASTSSPMESIRRLFFGWDPAPPPPPPPTTTGAPMAAAPAIDTPLPPPQWYCRATFQPKNGAVRDIQWNPFDHDVFAMVTDSGTLLIYNVTIPSRPYISIPAAHAGEATCVDWHPTLPFVVATGGAQDRTVKVWNVEEEMTGGTKDAYQGMNAHSLPLPRSSTMTVVVPTTSSSPPELSSRSYHYRQRSPPHHHSRHRGSVTPPAANDDTSPTTSPKIHTLAIAAPITRVKWRPGHDDMIMVSTGPMSGSIVGCGGIGLWSWRRPFMAVRRVEGHGEGSVMDVCWWDGGETEDDWRWVVSVGKDGKCLLQDLAKGSRPLSQVPSSTFAIASLSPYQIGCGSLQIISVHQRIPSGEETNALSLTRHEEEEEEEEDGTRETTGGSNEAKVKNIHQNIPASIIPLSFSAIDTAELPPDDSTTSSYSSLVKEQKLPEPPIPIDDKSSSLSIICPELVHISRFAKSYRYRRSSSSSSDGGGTPLDLCEHNASIAERWMGSNSSLVRFWLRLASLLGKNTDGAEEMDEETQKIVVDLLTDRANRGDVQTCVVACEVGNVLRRRDDPSQQQQQQHHPPLEATNLVGLDVTTVREWYLNYIDILLQMSLFCQACDLIRTCRDPIVYTMSQQSTTIHESCPYCTKPLRGGGSSSRTYDADAAADEDDDDGDDYDDARRQFRLQPTSRRSCTSCRRRIGSCFVCQRPCKDGLFVWCPGCGHGGHLDCAIEWFGDIRGGKGYNVVCPTGCGHKCNFTHQLNSFPKTASFDRLPSK